MSNRHENIGQSMKTKLGNQPENAYGDDGLRIVQHAMVQGHGFPLLLDEGGDDGSEDVDGEANSHALKAGDAGGVFGEAAGEGDEEALVEDEAGEDGEGAEDGEAGRGDFEGGGPREVAVHGAGLLDDEAVLVGVGGDKKDPRCPNGKHSD